MENSLCQSFSKGPGRKALVEKKSVLPEKRKGTEFNKEVNMPNV